MTDFSERPKLSCARELIDLVEDVGILPFFNSGIDGYSLEAITAPDHWFAEGVDGPWEWKCSFVQQGLAYCKGFRRKAVFLSREWYGILACFRRDGYDFEGMYEDGFVPHGGKYVIDALEKGSMVSTELRRVTGSASRGAEAPAGKDFDSIIATLQMQTFISVSAFEYAIDRKGKPYGWGLARYALSDERFGAEIARAEELYTPAQARQMIIEHIAALCPNAAAKQIERLVK